MARYSGSNLRSPETTLLLMGPSLLFDMLYVTGRTVIDLETGEKTITGKQVDLCAQLA